jgi:hypothetical protein
MQNSRLYLSNKKSIESSLSETDSQIIRGKHCLATPDIKFPSFEVMKNNFELVFITKTIEYNISFIAHTFVLLQTIHD